jgi:hypothetical protein
LYCCVLDERAAWKEVLLKERMKCAGWHVSNLPASASTADICAALAASLSDELGTISEKAFDVEIPFPVPLRGYCFVTLKQPTLAAANVVGDANATAKHDCWVQKATDILLRGGLLVAGVHCKVNMRRSRNTAAEREVGTAAKQQQKRQQQHKRKVKVKGKGKEYWRVEMFDRFPRRGHTLCQHSMLSDLSSGNHQERLIHCT